MLQNSCLGLKLYYYATSLNLDKDGCGVYLIFNNANYKYYIGSTRNFKNRFISHCDNLNKKTHYNYKLQEDWLQFGSKVFIFVPLEIVKYENLLLREQVWLDNTKPNYNIRKIASKSDFKVFHSVISKEESLRLPF